MQVNGRTYPTHFFHIEITKKDVYGTLHNASQEAGLWQGKNCYYLWDHMQHGLERLVGYGYA